MAQQAAFMAGFGALCLLEREAPRWRERWPALGAELGLLGLAAALPFALACLLFWSQGVFDRFWFWDVTYAMKHGALLPLASGLHALETGIRLTTGDNTTPWLMGLSGLILAWKTPRLRRPATWITTFLACSFLCVCPGLYFRTHYFIFILPAVAVLGGAAVVSCRDYLSEKRAAALFAALMAMSSAPQLLVYYTHDDAALSRDIYPQDAGPEMVAVADYIRAHSSPADRIAVIGSEPQIYFYAQRHSVSDQIYSYPLAEPHPWVEKLRDDFIADISGQKPAYIVTVRLFTSWLTGTGAGRLTDWQRRYLPANYDLAGVVLVTPNAPPVAAWDAAATIYAGAVRHLLPEFPLRDDASIAGLPPGDYGAICVFRRKEYKPPGGT
jgi:hypothetical protein